MVAAMAERIWDGVSRTTKTGWAVVMCGRCFAASGHTARPLADWSGDETGPFLVAEFGWSWVPADRCYQPRTDPILSRKAVRQERADRVHGPMKPRPGEVVRCPFCRAPNLVPDPPA